MTRLVVDASVVVKWFLPEVESVAARAMLSEGSALFAPGLLHAEVGNVLWKHWRAGSLTDAEVDTLTADLRAAPVLVVPSRVLLSTAMSLARRHQRTVYDALYLALAVRLNCQLVTADKRFYNALAASDLAERVRWIGAEGSG